MTPTFTVRELAPSDAQAWSKLRIEALELEPLAFGSSVPDDPSTLVAKFLERLRPADDAAIFGAFVDSSTEGTAGTAGMAGIVGLRRNESAKERHGAFIWGMYVAPQARRCGAGRLLMEQAIAHARLWPGVEQVLLSVTDADPAARRLYERSGFRAWGCQPRALCWDGRFVDETHMVLDLRDVRECP